MATDSELFRCRFINGFRGDGHVRDIKCRRLCRNYFIQKNSIPCKIYPQEFKSRFVVFFKCLCCLSLWWGDDGLFLPQVPLARTWCASWDKKEILIFHCKDNTNDRSGLTDLCCNRYIITKTVSLLLFCRRRPVVASFFKLK